ncbi:MAG TPA: LysR substrate-binding domain-containing protein [Planctomycetota bacterium]|nr:LysR substrate-binding domain-containing protein [Planctomycetota bacterium]
MRRTQLVELRHLHYFLAVAEELHFGRAAARLGIAQPPLSQQIRRLEAALDVTLFDRTGRRTTLTAAGRALAARAPAVLEAAASLRDDVREAARGRAGVLRIGAGASASLGVVPEMIARFRASYPDVVVRLDDRASAPHDERLRQRLIDLALLRSPVPGMRATVVREERLLAVVPHAHPLGRRRSIRVAELRNEPFVLFPREVAPDFHDDVQAAFVRAGFTPRIVAQATEWATVASMVAAGMGVTVAPTSAATMPRAGASYVQLRDADVRVRLLALSRDEDDPLVSAFVAEAMRTPARTAGIAPD